jgi:predicted nucleic acid-binding protein
VLISALRCVVDTSLLIDLYVGEVLSAAFCLPFTLAAPDVIVEELVEPDGRALVARGLSPIELSGAEVERVFHICARFRNVSVNDLFALVAAESRGATLLTSDRHLRTAAEALGIQVHGTLWLLEEMVGHRLVSAFAAAEAVERMLKRGRRLPRRECLRLLTDWRK